MRHFAKYTVKDLPDATLLKITGEFSSWERGKKFARKDFSSYPREAPTSVEMKLRRCINCWLEEAEKIGWLWRVPTTRQFVKLVVAGNRDVRRIIASAYPGGSSSLGADWGLYEGHNMVSRAELEARAAGLRGFTENVNAEEK